MLLRISLVVMLALLAQNRATPGVRVSGRVVGLPPGTPSGMMRANMARQGGTIFEALGSLVDAEGRFEFLNVPPGQYTLRIVGPNPPSMRVTVAGSDITDLSVTLPALILGHATVEGGGALPLQALGGTALPAALQLEAFRVPLGTGGTNVTPRGDGSFLLPIATPGDYWVRPIVLPIGYELKSMTFGNVDLMKQPLAVALPLAAQTIEIVLAKTKASGVHVSGRVKDIPAPTPVRRPSLTTIRTATNPQTGTLVVDTQYFAEVLLNADGSFDLPGIPPGRYILQILPGPLGMPLEVATNDIDQLEFSLGGPSTPVPATNLLLKLQSAFPVSPPAAPNNAATLVVSESGSGQTISRARGVTSA